MECLELRNGGIIDHCHAAAVTAPGHTPIVAIADVAMDAACECVFLDRFRLVVGVVMPCRVGAHAGSSSAFAKVAHPHSGLAFLSAAASIVPKHLVRKHEQVLDACGDAVVVLHLTASRKYSRVSATASAQMACNWLATRCDTLTLRYGSSVGCVDASSACWTSEASVARESFPMPYMCESAPGRRSRSRAETTGAEHMRQTWASGGLRGGGGGHHVTPVFAAVSDEAGTLQPCTDRDAKPLMRH